MGDRYLLQLADWCREAGLVTVELGGWHYNARGSGGYDDDKPWCVMWHHTASKAAPDDDAAYIAWGHEDSPIANLLLDREGTVWVCAGGATNTNGKGGPFTVSRGTVPLDSMNTYALGIEAANNGTGEPWPQVQIDAYFALSNKLAEKLGLYVDDICHHSVWAVGRKIDPATAAAVQGPWRPGATNSSGSWSLLDTQHEAGARFDGSVPPLPPEPLPPPNTTPPPPLTEDDKSMIVALDSNGTAWIGDGMTKYNPTEDDFNVKVLLAGDDCLRLVNTKGERVSGWGSVRTEGDNVIQALGRTV